MLNVSSHTLVAYHIAIFLAARISLQKTYPILSLNVVGLRLHRRIARCYEFEVKVLVGAVVECHRSQSCGVAAQLLSVEIHLQAVRGLQVAEVSLAGGRYHQIAVARVITQSRYLETW